MEEVSEVMAINAIAPFALVSRLKPLMCPLRVDEQGNVSEVNTNKICFVLCFMFYANGEFLLHISLPCAIFYYLSI